MKRVMLALLVCLCTSACLGAATLGQLTFTASGFSIRPLEGWETLTMLLPASDGFAPNVNVQIQPYPGTLDSYIALSKGQLKQMGFQAVREARRGKSGWVVEYTGYEPPVQTYPHHGSQ